MNILEKFLQDAKEDNIINSAMLKKLSYRIQFYKKELTQGQELPIHNVVGQSEQLKNAEQEGYKRGWEEGAQYGYSAACEGR